MDIRIDHSLVELPADLDVLVTSHYGPDEVADALTASRRDPATVKAMVRPGG